MKIYLPTLIRVGDYAVNLPRWNDEVLACSGLLVVE